MPTLDKLRTLLEDNNTQTLRQLGASLGVTPSRVQQLCAKHDLVRISPRPKQYVKRQLSINMRPEMAQWVSDKALLRSDKSQNAVVNIMMDYYREHHKEGSNDI